MRIPLLLLPPIGLPRRLPAVSRPGTPSSADALTPTRPESRLSGAELKELTDIALSAEDWAISYKPAADGPSVYKAAHAASGRRISARSLVDFHRRLDAFARDGKVPPRSERVRTYQLAHETRQAFANQRHDAACAAITHKAEQDEIAERWMAVAGR
ncbi:hypothetical protein HNR23_004254 [Nocardiopsis mwathae]|uniref:Uncharacterized protein n=1 Tax=Nocardiopsis mwathae TaxID=1472723 RepID=A0A7W9YLI0_9ACTN|nr:hypothetical protein [Nocardiopsis mwathae]MBB6174194.1 hypothetical protein [Nocardiopsis mwathae]